MHSDFDNIVQTSVALLTHITKKNKPISEIVEILIPSITEAISLLPERELFRNAADIGIGTTCPINNDKRTLPVHRQSPATRRATIQIYVAVFIVNETLSRAGLTPPNDTILIGKIRPFFQQH